MNGCYESYSSCFDVKDHWPLSCQFRNSRCPNPLRSEVFWRESPLPMSFLFNSSLCSFNAWRNWRSCATSLWQLFLNEMFPPPCFLKNEAPWKKTGQKTNKSLVGGFSPTHFKNMLVKLDHFPRDPGENKNSWNHQLVKVMKEWIKEWSYRYREPYSLVLVTAQVIFKRAKVRGEPHMYGTLQIFHEFLPTKKIRVN